MKRFPTWVPANTRLIVSQLPRGSLTRIWGYPSKQKSGKQKLDYRARRDFALCILINKIYWSLLDGCS